MKRRFVYHVEFFLNGWSKIRGIDVIAESKADAYDKAVFEVIPAQFDKCPYSAWVSSVTYSNGNHREFNTCDGMPY